MDDSTYCCDAYLEGPEGETLCGQPTMFGVERTAVDMPLHVCPDHLGSILMHADRIAWPPIISWDGPGERPQNALSLEQVRELDDQFFKGRGAR
ncbi:hypothetical protein LVY72_12335 [Arthrobacter sp. I2-34]|uniref:Uncharacterized protein n=1 Tax=Arthrobacter hankyongi TaxID=2904801 RepID=A0ABS9L7N9_9MICC|nr:hypothetical protein [Arthrobacter hankyongi]MCG2622691.1 hypothetical protein [Arthrobacter hankyongi]